MGADNKTAVAAILTTIQILCSNNLQNSCHPIDIVFTVSEESGNHGAIGLDYTKFKGNKGFVFDAGGRDFGDIIIASPYYVRFNIEILGRSAHDLGQVVSFKRYTNSQQKYSQL